MLKTGFKEMNINPPLGIGVSGYYIPRFAKGIIDDLTTSALVLSLNDKKFVTLNSISIISSPLIVLYTHFDKKSMLFVIYFLVFAFFLQILIFNY